MGEFALQWRGEKSCQRQVPRVTKESAGAMRTRLPNHMSLAQRNVQPELLETYPDDHPDAIIGRKDLLLVNGIMGNHRWVMRTLKREKQPGWRLTELGAGDGALSLKLIREGVIRSNELHAMDLAGRPAAWPAEAKWMQGDFTVSPLPSTEIVLANLFLHHFQTEQLRALGERLSPETRLLIAAEPARQFVHTILGRLFCALTRLHPITRYDMQVSIRAGFRENELSELLGLGPEWETTASSRPFGAYRFVARRRSE